MNCSTLLSNRFFLWVALVFASAPVYAQTAKKDLPTLTNIVQVLRLSPAEANREYPIEVRAVATYSDPEWGLLFIQDRTAGIYVHRLSAVVIPQVGDLFTVRAVSSQGLFSPILQSATLEPIAKDALPPARPTPIEELNSGSVDSQRVELEGVVQEEEEVGNRLRLTVASGLNRCTAIVLRYDGYRGLRLIDSRIRFRGVAGTQFVNQTLLGFRVYVSGLADLTIVQAPSIDAFARPVQSRRDLLAYSPSNGSGQRVHVQGVVTMHWPGRVTFMRDATGGVCLEPSGTVPLAVGERVDAVGFHNFDPTMVHLEATVIRSLGKSEAPQAVVVPNLRTLQDQKFNGELIQIDAELLCHDPTDGGIVFTLSDPNQTFQAVLQCTNPAALLPQFSAGSRVRVTGVAQVLHSRLVPPRSTVVWLRSPSDVTVLKLAWSMRRWATLCAIGTIGCGLVFGGLPVLWMRRRSLRRIEHTVEDNERQLRRHVEERERIGQDLHDNIMQSIYAVGLGLEDCRRLIRGSPDRAEERLAIAIRALNSVMHDVRQFIGGLEPRVLNGSELKTALKSLALTTGDSSTRFLIQTDPNATHCLTPHQATHLLNIAKEAMSNSLRHAHARQTQVTLALDVDHVRLEVSDDGAGFDPASASLNGNGLRNVQARARELGARFEIVSAPGEGTRLRVHLPLTTS